MATPTQSTSSPAAEAVTDRDILFECPSCGKSLVVDESAEGMIIDCPQCQANVIVPPRPSGQAAPPPPAPAKKSEPAAPVPTAPTPVVVPAPVAGESTTSVADLHKELTALATRIKEVQHQWADATNRIATRINDINRELVGLARLESAHKQALKDWNQLVGKLAATNDEVMKPAPTPPPTKS